VRSNFVLLSKLEEGNVDVVQGVSVSSQGCLHVAGNSGGGVLHHHHEDKSLKNKSKLVKKQISLLLLRVIIK
jgi:hypothetical protein